MLKPQDILVALKLMAIGRQAIEEAPSANPPWTYASMAMDLGMSSSEVHAAVQRLLQSGLAHRDIGAGSQLLLLADRFEEFTLQGMRYVFYPQRGEMTRGLPTCHAAPPLVEHIVTDDSPPPVWPDPMGESLGQSFLPLYKSVPRAARNDAALYRLLVLVDAIRGGRARERQLASKLFKEELRKYQDDEQSQSGTVGKRLNSPGPDR